MYWATGSARVLAVEPSLLKLSPDGEDEELELVLPVITSGQGEKQDIEGDSQNGIQSRIVKGTGSGIVDMARNEQGSLWVTITRESIQLWVHRVRLMLYWPRCCHCCPLFNAPITDSLSSIFIHQPIGVIAKVVRTPKSLLDHGANQRVVWKPDSSMLVVVVCLFFCPPSLRSPLWLKYDTAANFGPYHRY